MICRGLMVRRDHVNDNTARVFFTSIYLRFRTTVRHLSNLSFGLGLRVTVSKSNCHGIHRVASLISKSRSASFSSTVHGRSGDDKAAGGIELNTARSGLWADLGGGN